MLLGLMLFLCLVPAAARAQRAVDVQAGKWLVPGPDPTLYSAALWRDFWGPLGYSLRGIGLVDDDSAGRSLYGVQPELTLLRHLGGGHITAYVVGGAGPAVSVGGSSGLAALWNAGLGLELSAPVWFSATLEARRFVEDRGFRGFWDLGEADRRGWLVSVGFAFRWGGGSSGSGAASAGPARPGSDGRAPGSSDLEARHRRPETTTAGLAGRIVETALDAMGEPYRWGGTSTEHGFDCSGLVWYAYTSHGVDVPRVSRAQARVGRPVPPELDRLAPGDILTFSNRGGPITHVGLYVGDGLFIHATSSGGVRIGALDGTADANDRWWRARWVGARRILER